MWGDNAQNNYIPDGDLAKIRSRLTGDDVMIMDLLLETGYRLDDVLRLRRYQLSGKSITVRERKTGNVRTVTYSGRYRVTGCNLGYVFSTRRGRAGDRRKVHRTTFWRHFERAVVSAGLDGRGYTVHSLRKCYAVALYRRTGSVELVQRDLGHHSIATTALYLLGALSVPASSQTPATD